MKLSKIKLNALQIIVFFSMVMWLLLYSATQSRALMIDVTELVSAKETIEQPIEVRAALSRMILTGAIPENITFTGAATSNDVFDHDHGGGNVTYVPPPYSTCSPQCLPWTYLPATKKDHGWYAHGSGTSATDIITYLPNVTAKVCREIQKQLGYASSTPPKQASASFDPTKPGVYSATGSTTTIKSKDNTLDGKREGCFDNHVGYFGDSSFSYYHVLHEQ